MTTRTGKAFCPGHITGLFRIMDQAEDPLHKGSRGAGLCLQLGATTDVAIGPGEGNVHVFINDLPEDAPVTTSVVNQLVPKGNDVVVTTKLDLPMGQGFGMSGAGALSTAMAIRAALGLDEHKVVQAAHVAEVEHLSGLGDVAAQFVGGVSVRRTEGPPPWGEVVKVEPSIPERVLLAVLGGPISTKQVLQDPDQRNKINEAGQLVLAELTDPTTIEVFEASKRFADSSLLMSPEVEHACNVLEELGTASMCMLGNSIFFIPDDDIFLDSFIRRTKAKMGFDTKIDTQGARILY